MPLWGKINQADNAPKNGVNDKGTTGSAAFDVTVFGIDNSEVPAVAGTANPGWVKRTTGTGGRSGRVQSEVLVAIKNMEEPPEPEIP